MIDKKWELLFSRAGGWWGMATKNTMTAKIQIETGRRDYPTFEDAYAVLEAKIKLHEEGENTMTNKAGLDFEGVAGSSASEGLECLKNLASNYAPDVFYDTIQMAVDDVRAEIEAKQPTYLSDDDFNRIVTNKMDSKYNYLNSEMQPTTADKAEALAALEGVTFLGGNMWSVKDLTKYLPTIRAALTSAPSVPDGWQLVPIEPSLKQISSGQDILWKGGARPCAVKVSVTTGSFREIYKAMLAAAPQPPVKEE